MRDSEEELKQAMAAQFANMKTMQAENKQARIDGEGALRRLLPIAQGHSGQCKTVAKFLLGCYNGYRFPFDLTDFRTLDYVIFRDCMAVLRMDYKPYQEVHCYFDNGGHVFEKLAEDWGLSAKPEEDAD